MTYWHWDLARQLETCWFMGLTWRRRLEFTEVWCSISINSGGIRTPRSGSKLLSKPHETWGARRKWKTRPERYDKKVHHIGARRRVHPVLSGIDWPWNYQFGHIETGDTGVRWGQCSEFEKMVHVLFGVCSVSDSLSAYVGEEYIPRAVCHAEWICLIHIT